MKKRSSPEKKLNILITGAGGFIGGHLTGDLKRTYEVFPVFSKNSQNDCKNTLTVDLRRRLETESRFKEFSRKNRIDVVIHLASRLASVDNAQNMGVFYDNLEITSNMIEVIRILKPRKMVHFSSMAVYPNEDGVYTEASEIRPSANNDCLYGLSKFCSENMLDFFLKKENILVSHLRIGQVVGEGMCQDRIIPVMIKELREKNTITVFGNGERVTNFIDVEKVLSAVRGFIEKDRPGIFNVGDENSSLLKLAQQLIKKYGNQKSKIIKNPNGSRVKFYLKSAKLKDKTT